MKKDWTYKKLGEVGTVITGSTPSTKDNMNYSSQDVCFFKPSDLSSDSLVKLSKSEFYISKHAFEHSRKLPKGSVLTTCIGIIGKVGILTEEATCNQQINAIIPNPDIIISDFLGYSIMSKKHILQASANAPVVPLLNKTQFSDFSIPIPPLSIQRSIVAELDLLHSVISKKKEQLRELDNLAQSLFYQMFGDPITNPMGWEIKKLGEVASKIGSGATPKGGNESYKDEGISLIRSLNVYNNFFTYKDLAHIDDVQANELKNVIVCANDILLNITGASVARCCIVPNDVLPARVNQHVAIIRLNDDISHVFMHRQLTSIEYQEKLLLISRGSGATREALTKGQLEQLTIILPPLSLQQSFAAKVSAIEAQKQAITQSIHHTEALLAQRMDRYFG